MNVTVKISKDIVDEARKNAAISLRSVPKQIEYWARLGKGF
jgi:hypothetical protein